MGCGQQLAAAYFDQRGKAPTAVALADMLNVVEGDALRADAAPVDLRVAARGGALYLDRATPAASAIPSHPDRVGRDGCTACRVPANGTVGAAARTHAWEHAGPVP